MKGVHPLEKSPRQPGSPSVLVKSLDFLGDKRITLDVGEETLHGSLPKRPNLLPPRSYIRNVEIYNHLPRLFCFLGGGAVRALGSNSPNSNDKAKPHIQCVS